MTSARREISVLEATRWRVDEADYRPLFPSLQRAPKSAGAKRTAELRALAEGMFVDESSEKKAGATANAKEDAKRDAKRDNRHVAAGYTYFGQFLAHDLSFFVADEEHGEHHPGGARNLRTPRLDLDGVYGGGMRESPHLYRSRKGASFLLGGRKGDASMRRHHRPTTSDHDLPRNQEGVALVADPRNAESTMIAQVQLGFLLAHNVLADRARSEGLPEPAAFEAARREICFTYQRFVATEYLPAVVDEECADWIASQLAEKERGRSFQLVHFAPGNAPYIPLEFVLAVMRFGHSMIRPSYHLNEHTTKPLPLTPRTAWKNASFDDHLMSCEELPDGWTIDWSFFLPVSNPVKKPNPRLQPQPSRLIDRNLTAHLSKLPPEKLGPHSLPLSTLLRGELYGLPTGEEVAVHMAKSMPEHVKLDPLVDESTPAGGTPLWLWILKEAKACQDGLRLGRVGSRILAEVVLGLLEADPSSYIARQPSFRSALGDKLGDFLSYGALHTT